MNIEADIQLRRATEKDCTYVWKLRNHPTVREYSINNSEIPYAEHEKWFSAAHHDERIRIFIGSYKGKDIGTIRFNIEEVNSTIAYISIVLSPEARNSGLGTALLKKGSEFALREFDLLKILAKIKPENIASIKAFTKAGYKFIEKNDIWIMEYRLSDSDVIMN